MNYESPKPDFALRFFRTQRGLSAIVYRRTLAQDGAERLQRISRISPLAVTAGRTLLRPALTGNDKSSKGEQLFQPGPGKQMDTDWGPRVASYGLVAEGLQNADTLARAAAELKAWSGTEAAWWLGQMTVSNSRAMRARRALRILIGAVR